MATVEPTLYEILDVPPDADTPTLKRAYTRKLKHVHPDVAGPGSQSLFRMVQHAYDTLSDPTARDAYDTTLGTRPASGSAGGAAPHSPDSGRGAHRDGATTGSARDDTPPRSNARSSARSESPGPGWAQVPTGLYDGPLPRAHHHVAAMPWLTDPDTRPPRLTHAGLRPEMMLLVVTAAAAAITLSLAGNPLFTILTGLVALFLAGRQLRRNVVPRRPALAAALMLGVAALPIALSALAPSSVPPRDAALALLAATGWTLLLLVLTAARRRRDRVRRRDATAAFSWGTPGQGLAEAIDTLGVDAAGNRLEAARLTAAELEHFLAPIPGVRVVHALHVPSARSAGLDHAVLCGDKVAFLDSAAWSPAVYTMNRDWVTIRADHPDGTWRFRESRLHQAVTAYTQLLRAQRLSRLRVRGYLVVHPTTLQRPIRLDSTASSGSNQMVTAPDLIRALGEWFTDDTQQAHTVDAAALSLLARTVR